MGRDTVNMQCAAYAKKRRDEWVKHLQFLIKPASSACNLRCRYCFYADIAQNRAVAHMGMMEPETVDALLREAFRCIDPDGAIHFAFQGGEPTLAGLAFFRDFSQKADRQRPRGVSLSYSIQTNGMAIDEQWIAYWKEYDFLVGISLDGYKDLHDHHRVDARGKPTWKKVSQAFKMLNAAGVRTNVLCVVTGPCARHPESVYRELKKLGAAYLQFIPCLDPLEKERGAMPFSLTPEAYGTFLCRLFDLWYQDWAKGDYHSIRFFDDHIHLLLGCPEQSACATCGRCGAYYVVEGDGSVYPCDFFVLDRWKMGTLGQTPLDEMARSEPAQAFLAWGQEKPAECAACRWRPLCNGGCKNDWERDGAAHNHYCKAYQTFFAHAEERLCIVARAEWQARRAMEYSAF